jgi:hypothetical protein
VGRLKWPLGIGFKVLARLVQQTTTRKAVQKILFFIIHVHNEAYNFLKKKAYKAFICGQTEVATWHWI